MRKKKAPPMWVVRYAGLVDGKGRVWSMRENRFLRLFTSFEEAEAFRLAPGVGLVAYSRAPEVVDPEKAIPIR